MRSGWRELLAVLPLLLLAAAHVLLCMFDSSEGARMIGAVSSSAEERRGNSDEQDHNDYLYARRTRHGYSLVSMLSLRCLGEPTHMEEERAKERPDSPPCYFHSRPRSSSKSRCQSTDLYKGMVCARNAHWTPRRRETSTPITCDTVWSYATLRILDEQSAYRDMSAG